MDLTDDEMWIVLDGCRTEGEREFIREMSRRASGWRELGIDNDHLLGTTEPFVMLMLDISKDKRVLRTLRADYRDSKVVVGVDETQQSATDLDEASPDVLVVTEGTPRSFATAAADWMEREIRRFVQVREEC